MPVPALSAANALTAVSASSATDAWAVGFEVLAPRHRQAVLEHWNGSAWSPDVSDAVATSSATLTGVADLSPANAWAITAGSGSQGLAHWNGTAWSVVPSPAPGFGPHISGIAARSASDVIAVGDTLPSQNGGPLDDVILRFNGTSWSSDTGSAIPGFLMAAAAAPGGAEEFAVGNSSGSTGVILSHP